MDDYPDPDEEYELMYADELEMIREESQHAESNIIKKKTFPAKRSLDFSSPASKKLPQTTTDTNPSPITELPLTPTLQPIEDLTPVTSNVSSNKRTVDDLFGDIGDIDFNEIELPSKRQKTEEEDDLDLINKILESRKLKQILLEPKNRSLGNRASYNVKENISMDIPRWPFIPVTNSNGDRMYVKIECEDVWEKSLDVAPEQQSLHASYTKTWEEARKILEEKQQQLISSECQSQPLPEVEPDGNSSQLWVEKYKPQSYVDLLSEEPVNRALLHWLHLWDKVVFKKEVKTMDPQQRTTFSKRAGQFQLSSNWKGKKEAEPELDEGGRPRLKVALLCGPPGVGKTTLAHLLAKLAGYRPVELNASDERSTEAFRTALQSATLMRSVLDADRRPNCLILDEIDGAPLPTVELLVKWCTATAEQSGGGKKKPKSQPLKRPVIAICNDLYATSLRPLRAVALVVPVGGVSGGRLAGRLARLGGREGLAVSARAAAALAARVQGDVRAAIQVLSFIKARAKAQVNIEDVENVAIGTKDCNKSVMQALQAVFTTNDTDPAAILKTVNAAGEYDRLADGIFENYLSARVDGRMLVACETLSWLRYQDTVSAWIQRHQNYSLYGTLPLCIVRCHAVLASRTPQRLKFPTQAQEMYRKRQELESITCAVWRGSCAGVCRPRGQLRRDLLPLLPYLLAPKLRSPNVQLCSESERAALRSCAGAMCEYGLQYVQRRGPDSLYSFVLEPDIHRLAFFGNEERALPPPAVRQAIAREQQLEMIRRNEEMANRVASNTKTNSSQSSRRIDSKDAAINAPAALPNHLQRLKPKDVQKTTPQVHKDFFGRVVPLSQVHRTDALPDVISSSSVFYQYREGFNNAVRRNVRTRDIL